jgi:hypothetical protein
MSRNRNKKAKPVLNLTGTIQRVRHVSDLGGFYIVACADKKILSSERFTAGQYVILGSNTKKDIILPIETLFERTQDKELNFEIGDDAGPYLTEDDFRCI